MMIVPTFVGPSSIEGVGLFAAAPIRAGQSIWQLDERFDLLLTPDDLAGLPDLQRSFVERYGYPHMTRPGLTVVEFDHGRFMNHSETPNTDFQHPETGYAIRDIAAGEELTCDYAEFDPGFAMQPGRSFFLNGTAGPPPPSGIHT
ncbi:SET domain-containing protein-lysine N-methyltransferase [Pacificimonas flava]|uniref:SET domain-containing protein-lysine N-methyltransferase n=2 Tax=Pacificimonas TaxID=1960290 RepID=A0A219B3Q2_9SPHN|nr:MULTISPECIES: SET domain-containing protein-lysine N-methyltransferase [Pacificimonas]MBZ6377276.1 SET domain-containing protein-lysine N-methyltransferase [Pacificimonas aurantium]OWV33012.1 SET domain-containing protein-lysine N-methyltransferase [Pacificimonas flava]